MNWNVLKPNQEGDWINQRHEGFDKFITINPKKSLIKIVIVILL